MGFCLIRNGILFRINFTNILRWEIFPRDIGVYISNKTFSEACRLVSRNFTTIQGFWSNEYLPMATSRFCTKCLKSACEIRTVYASWKPSTWIWIRSLTQAFYQKRVLKTFSKLNTRSSHPEESRKTWQHYWNETLAQVCSLKTI